MPLAWLPLDNFLLIEYDCGAAPSKAARVYFAGLG
jgi:hypothetical protein